MAQSPAHYRAALRDEKRESAPMRFGKLVHQQLLGGGTVLVYEKARTGNAWKAFKAEHEGEFIVTQDEHDRSLWAAESLLNHAQAAELLDGEHEREIDWSFAGRKCQSHVDVLGKDFVTELKTSTTVNPDKFVRLALRMGYHAQCGFYELAAQSLGRAIARTHIVAVEVNEPFDVVVYRVTPRAIEEGQKLCRLWMERLRGCEETDTWPGYCQSAVDLDVVEDVGLLIDGEEIAA